MKKSLLYSFLFILQLQSISAQDVSIFYELHSSSSAEDTVLIQLRSATSQAVDLTAINFSFVFNSTCVSFLSFASNVFPTAWTPNFQFQQTRNVVTTYNGFSYDQRLVYGISDANTPSQYVSVPGVNQGALTVMKLLFQGSCTASVYMEDQAEFAPNQIANANFMSIPYVIVRPPIQNFPVDLLSFEGFAIDDETVKLQWQTLQERNSDYFSIEKSLSADFDDIFELGQITAAGESDLPLSYSYIDNIALVDAVYYRLKIIDIDGRFEYSNWVEVKFNTESHDFDMDILGNPVSDQLHIRLFSRKQALYEFRLLDMKGRVLMQTEDSLSSEEAVHLSWDMDQYSAGIYMVSVVDTDTGVQIVKKVLKN